MRADVQLPTRFIQTQDRHQVHVLVTVAGEMPANRAPINVALVLDRSGSMSGEPLEAAKAAAERFAECLGPHDRLAVVTFDDEVNALFTGPGGGPDARDLIRAIQAGGCTNLSGGWLEGRKLVVEGKLEGTNRVVLFTDGQANRGITDLPRLAGLTGGVAKDAVSTSCIGFGPHFNEDLLKGMADGGRGHFWYVESLDQMTGVFEEEIEGLVALAAQNVVVRVVPVHPDLHGVTHPAGLAVERDDLAWVVRLGDLLATSPRELPLRLHVENVGELGTVELARLEVIADVIRDGGILHQKVTLPIVANLDRSDRVVPVVEETFLRFEAVQARREAIERADRGDLDGAARVLREAAAKLEPWRMASVRSAELADDLVGEAERFAARRYEVQDRKYHIARGEAEAKGRSAYTSKVGRHRKPEPR